MPYDAGGNWFDDADGNWFDQNTPSRDVQGEWDRASNDLNAWKDKNASGQNINWEAARKIFEQQAASGQGNFGDWVNSTLDQSKSWLSGGGTATGGGGNTATGGGGTGKNANKPWKWQGGGVSEEKWIDQNHKEMKYVVLRIADEVSPTELRAQIRAGAGAQYDRIKALGFAFNSDDKISRADISGGKWIDIIHGDNTEYGWNTNPGGKPEGQTPPMTFVDSGHGNDPYMPDGSRNPNYKGPTPPSGAPPPPIAPPVAPPVPAGGTSGLLTDPWTQQFAFPDFAPSAAFTEEFSYDPFKAPAPFTETFNYDPFKAPSWAEVEADPFYQGAQREGQKAIQRSAAANGTLLTGGTLKDLSTFSRDTASAQADSVYGRKYNEYGTGLNTALTAYGSRKDVNLDTYNREYNEYGTGLNTALTAYGSRKDVNLDTYNRTKDLWSTNYGKQRSMYDLDRNIFESNADRAYDKLYKLSALGRY